ncbi:glucan endo-1 3-beta-D-glucosidase-like [Prunus yedoensis var. nudiflora]|uniref:Glucan endo-1 3-beta-D-glucosidase-like n=1 Tax=Prunus yedoensis var. nudiflora TaxID=2094558 RepID=A0A314Y7E2_PRUYE|nr:glucan endo-1 3-beta-D-glucosidase-like [Prunus yedoensis var. nudiflora]
MEHIRLLLSCSCMIIMWPPLQHCYKGDFDVGEWTVYNPCCQFVSGGSGPPLPQEKEDTWRVPKPGTPDSALEHHKLHLWNTRRTQ